MSKRDRYSRRDMLFGRFLRGMAEGVADELHREVVERAVEASGQAAAAGESEEVTEGTSRPSAATARAAAAPSVAQPSTAEPASSSDAPSAAEPGAPSVDVPSEEVNWNPPPKPTLYATRPDLPAPPRVAARNRKALHRPPGALPEPEFLAGCTRKNDCADACPVNAIRPVEGEVGDIHSPAGTPHIEAGVEACISCEDTPCITACGPQVLTLARGVRMGTAKIAPSACIAYRGVLCTTCVDRCPVPGAMELVGGRPRILSGACTGCGVCYQVCPAPRNAVLLVPGND